MTKRPAPQRGNPKASDGSKVNRGWGTSRLRWREPVHINTITERDIRVQLEQIVQTSGVHRDLTQLVNEGFRLVIAKYKGAK